MVGPYPSVLTLHSFLCNTNRLLCTSAIYVSNSTFPCVVVRRRPEMSSPRKVLESHLSSGIKESREWGWNIELWWEQIPRRPENQIIIDWFSKGRNEKEWTHHPQEMNSTLDSWQEIYLPWTLWTDKFYASLALPGPVLFNRASPLCSWDSSIDYMAFSSYSLLCTRRQIGDTDRKSRRREQLPWNLFSHTTILNPHQPAIEEREREKGLRQGGIFSACLHGICCARRRKILRRIFCFFFSPT